MSNLYLNAECELFCLLTVAFLYFFQQICIRNQSVKNTILYLCSFVGILFSAAGTVIVNLTLESIFFAVSGIFCCFAVYFCYECSFIAARNTTASALQKSIVAIVCVLVGALSFYLQDCGVSFAAFVMAFAVLFVFAMEQYNRMRVDNLTKLYNRYGMDAELREQVRQYNREESDSFYLIVCDLDHFKYINDTWGHPEGDKALILVASILAKTAKKYNSEVFRIGGDEFIIITDKSEEGLADAIINEIDKELDKVVFRDDFDIEMSFGSVIYKGEKPIDELIATADKEMYIDKGKSKNPKYARKDSNN